MAIWEYKVITSGPHGFASPALLETHLNSLGKDEWEIIHFHTLPNNSLAFHGLARRSTTRDWTPPPVEIASPPKPATYEPPAAKSSTAEEKPELPAAVAAEAEPAKTASTLRTFRDTERDQDPDAPEEEDDWDKWEQEEDELPTFFEAIKPLLRKNQKGPGMSAGIDHLARRWEQKESDIVGALKECGLTIPESEEAEPEYFEFEGDLFWVNRNNRGQLFINSREKPRPTFRIAQATKLASDDPAAVELAAERAAEKAEHEKQKAERAARQAAADAAREAARAARQARDEARAQASNAPSEKTPGNDAANSAAANSSSQTAEPAVDDTLPPGAEILAKIRPHMRRNRRGPGYSGSISFLSRALAISDAELIAAFTALGLHTPENPNDKPAFVEIGRALYWLNKDSRGGVWINGREKRESDNRPAAPRNGEPAADAPAATTAELPLAPDPSATSTPVTTAGDAPAADESTAPAQADTPTAGDPASPLTAVRLLLKPNKRGSGVSGEVGYLARTLEKSPEDFLATLTAAGLVTPADPEAKPVFVEHAGEIFWLNQNSTDGSLWLNAKPAKSAAKKSGAARPRSRKPKASEEEHSSE